MAKKIIILDFTPSNVHVAFWLDVPAARQPFYAKADLTSQYKDANAGELVALRTGVVTEQVDSYGLDADANIAAVRTFLEAELVRRQTLVNNTNLWKRYGTFFDGTSWTAGGVA